MSERIKLDLKYTFDCTPRDLFLALSKPSYLQNWISDEVSYDSITGIYTFTWAQFSESAKVSDQTHNKLLRWEWVDGEGREEDEYVEFRIEAIPGDDYIDLHIIDFCDGLEERQVRDGWDAQMKRLDNIL